MKIFKYFMNLAILLCLVQSMTFADIKNNDILYNQLITEIRCMVCQNQNIAESEAPLAIDLRNKVREMIDEGKDKDYIKKYLSERYSDFILYDPPFSPRNLILWIGPFLFLIIISFYFFRKSLKR
ncbi:MAG: cytochrome c-type biogenesis protein CcmH [Gammaproteobacteria bacterium]|jgi:cytochrome c-type biogenesis protein CcmH|nr:cytochrome c-type biogenesis protein CcmH [Gammaproteobacteria bacterium]